MGAAPAVPKDVGGVGALRAVGLRAPHPRAGDDPGLHCAADRVDALRAGYQAHTSKPVQPAELHAVIESLVAPKAGVG